MTERIGGTRRRLPTLLLGMALLGGGFARAVADAPPWAVLWRRISFFASSDRTERVARSPYFGQDPAFARSLLRADATWPADRDVLLEVGPGIPEGWAEDVRRRAAYLLAPRRVRVRSSSRPGVELVLGERER